LDSKTAIAVLDTSIKNQVATSIAHIYTYDRPVVKTIHHTINVTLTEAKLFAIKYGINQAICIFNINQIIVIPDLLHAAKRIFNSSSHPYQIQPLLISRDLRNFFTRDQSNSIKFWDCPSHENWTLHNLVDKETKSFDLIPMLSCKSS